MARLWPVLVATLSLAAAAQAATVAVIAVNEPWLRPAGRHAATDAYFELQTSEPLTLVGARSPEAQSVSLRGPQPVARIPLPPRQGVRFAPDGPRLRLEGLAHALKPGDRVPLVLVFEDPAGARREIPVDAEVRYHSPTDDERRAHGHAHGAAH
jgi:copper(I)-binding protein